jgi:hypothetical protein
VKLALRSRIMSSVSESKLTPVSIIRRVAAAALVLWMAGVGCLFGCEMGVVSESAGVEAREAAAQEESCPAFAGHDCCHKAEARSGGGPDARQTPGHAPRTDCCPLKSQSADPARKSGVADAPLAGAGTPVKLTPQTNTHAPLISHRLRVPDRGSTHLRCCVFLI